MLIGLLLAAGLMRVVPLAGAVLIATVWSEPLIASPVLLAAFGRARANRDRRSRHDLVASFLRTVAAELRAGRSLRSSLIAAIGVVPELDLAMVARSASAGRPLEEAAGILAALPGFGAAAAAIRVAARTGGSVVSIFDALTAEEVDEASLEREHRTLTAQARLSVTLVAGFPLVVLGYQVVSGDAVALLSHGVVGVGIVIVGGGLLLAGLCSVWMLLRGARRGR